MENEMIIFENGEVKLDVNVKDETVWLTLDQLTKLYGRDKSVISRHIKNALREELDETVVAKFATTAKDGKTYQVDYYNLDMIISVGYILSTKKMKVIF
ncbi:MAG: virulence RhuM family protein [Bacilli bacterium]|nr:virulence RhuM family protein [Bacilli bacterium]